MNQLVVYWAVFLFIFPSAELEVRGISWLVEEIVIGFEEIVSALVFEGEDCAVVSVVGFLVDEDTDVTFA